MQYITVFTPHLHNSLLKYLGDIESVKTVKLKFKLSKFLELVPDELKITHYVTAAEATASWISYLIGGQKESTTAVKSPTRPWSKPYNCVETTPSIRSDVFQVTRVEGLKTNFGSKSVRKANFNRIQTRAS